MSQQQLHNYTCTLSPELLEKARVELNEDPNTRQIEIQTLRERLLRYPGLTPRVDDAFLIKFLRARKFDQERTFELVLNYYQMKKDNEDIFAEMTPNGVKHMLDEKIAFLSPFKTRTGETLFIFRPGKWEAEKYTIEDAFRVAFVCMSSALESEETQVTGVHFVDDLGDLNWSHVKAFSPRVAKNISGMLQDALPMRLKGLHYVREPSFFDVIFTLVKPLLKEKLRSRLHFHGDKLDDLHKLVDPANLPEDYGGKQPPIDKSTEPFVKHVLSLNQRFEEDAKYGFVSMTIKNQKIKKTEDAMDSLPGTFKKLNVD